MATFERLLVAANRWVVIAVLTAMVVIVFANVCMRYLLGTSVIWSEEVARHLMIWLTFLGSGLALLVLGMLVLFVLLAWFGVDYAWRARFQMAAALEIPMSWIYLGMPVGCVLLALHLLFIARRYVRERGFVTGDGVDHDAAAAL